MKILGLQKTTLIDYPKKVACTIFLFGCNFRCGFCHNPGLVISPSGIEYSSEDILNFLESRKKYLDAVCFTGGEPLMTLEKSFLEKIKKMSYLIKIDTNGSFPEKLKEFVSAGLVDYVAMDIKSEKEKYSYFAGVELDIKKIEESIKIISKLENYEFRTTIIEKEHDLDGIKRMIEWIYNLSGKIKNYSLQGFKKEEELIDKRYLNFKDTSENYLESLKKEINKYIENIEIKV